MGEFYFTFFKISLHSSYLENWCLFFTDCDIICKTDEVNFVQHNPLEEQISNVYGVVSRTGLIQNYVDNKYYLLCSNEESYVISQTNFPMNLSKRFAITMDGYTLSWFLFCLNSSHNYVEFVTKHLSHTWSNLFGHKSGKFQSTKLLIKLLQPERHVMDLRWAKMACNTIHELRQLQYAMSWLSTLGGAFSALGEEQERCAKAAGAISIEQLRIALKLGDKIVITQCKLYFSLSLIQRGYCKFAKKLILEQYHSIRNSSVVDRKTLNMCKGIWARLKYELQKRNKIKRKNDRSKFFELNPRNCEETHKT